jgi:hypothetical protein
MDLTKIDNVEVDDIFTYDYPDFCDAFISSADYNGVAMTDKQLDEINENVEFVHECVFNQLY